MDGRTKAAVLVHLKDGRPLSEAALAAGSTPEELYSALRQDTAWSRRAHKAITTAKWRVHDVLTGRLPLPENSRTARYLLAYYELQEERGAWDVPDIGLDETAKWNRYLEVIDGSNDSGRGD